METRTAHVHLQYMMSESYWKNIVCTNHKLGGGEGGGGREGGGRGGGGGGGGKRREDRLRKGSDKTHKMIF